MASTEIQVLEMRKAAGHYFALRRVAVPTIHDCRDALNAMVINAELLGRLVEDHGREADGRARRCLRVVREEARRVEALLNRLVTELRSDASGASRVPLPSIVEAVAGLVEPAARDTSAVVSVRDPDAPASVWGRAGDLRLALWCLALRALALTPPGGQLTIESTCSDAFATLSVLPPSGPIDAGGDTKHDGASPEVSGLALQVAWDIAVAHGGTAGSDSQDEGGRQWIRLPVMP